MKPVVSLLLLLLQAEPRHFDPGVHEAGVEPTLAQLQCGEPESLQLIGIELFEECKIISTLVGQH